MPDICNSSYHSSTATLAKFLATTGPPEPANNEPKRSTPAKQPLFARLLLKKQTTQTSLPHLLSSNKQTAVPHRGAKHIALPAYHPTPDHDDSKDEGDSQHDSGVFHETTPKLENQHIPQGQCGYYSSVAELRFPMPPAPSHGHAPGLPSHKAHSHHHPTVSPEHSQGYSQDKSLLMRNDLTSSSSSAPSKPVKEGKSCPHCRQIIDTRTQIRPRRLSCPPAIASPNSSSSRQLKASTFTSKEAKLLLSMIEQLQSKLDKEQRSREKLERVLTRRQRHVNNLDMARSSWATDPLS